MQAFVVTTTPSMNASLQWAIHSARLPSRIVDPDAAVAACAGSPCLVLVYCGDADASQRAMVVRLGEAGAAVVVVVPTEPDATTRLLWLESGALFCVHQERPQELVRLLINLAPRLGPSACILPVGPDRDIDVSSGTYRRGAQRCDFTAAERRFLTRVAEGALLRPGAWVETERIRDAWPPETRPGVATLRTHAHRIREKIREVDQACGQSPFPEVLESRRGQGYRLRVGRAADDEAGAAAGEREA